MKRKIIIVSLVAMMISSVCAVNASAKGGKGVTIQKLLVMLGIGEDDPGVPCWSVGECPKDCDTFFLFCGPCIEHKGRPTGGGGLCH